MLRAAGLRERTVLVINAYASDGVETQPSQRFAVGYPEISGAMIADHFFNEVWLGNQWVRVDQEIDTGIMIYGTKPCIKILAAHDQVDHDFTRYWNYDSWQELRPYQYLSVREQAPAHGRP